VIKGELNSSGNISAVLNMSTSLPADPENHRRNFIGTGWGSGPPLFGVGDGLPNLQVQLELFRPKLRHCREQRTPLLKFDGPPAGVKNLILFCPSFVRMS